MKVLNLYSGLGGNRKLWKNVNVTAVENNEQIASVYQSLFPNDKVIVGDAHEYLLNYSEQYDFIWSSPPCQSHSKMMFTVKGRYGIKKYPDMSLYQEIIYLKHFYKGHWVVENVKPYYAPFIEPRATLGRHCFWSNLDIKSYDPPSLKNFITTKADTIQEWLGVNFDKSQYATDSFRLDQALRNCVHPELGLHILKEVKKSNIKANTLDSLTKLKAKAISIKQKQYEISN